MSTYSFDVAYVDGNAIRHHTETKKFQSQEAAYGHFVSLLRKFPVRDYYYLCKWGLKSQMDQVRIDFGEGV